jgi:hypothetical protein
MILTFNKRKGNLFVAACELHHDGSWQGYHIGFPESFFKYLLPKGLATLKGCILGLKYGTPLSAL